MNQVFTRWQSQNTFTHNFRKLGFYLRDDGGRSGAAVAGFVFYAVPLVGIVAGGDLDSACGTAQFHEQGDRRSGCSFGGEPDGNASRGNCLRGGARETFGAEARVVAHQNAGARFFRAYDVTGDRVRYRAHVLECEIFGDNGAPAVCTKYDVAHGKPV